MSFMDVIFINLFNYLRSILLIFWVEYAKIQKNAKYNQSSNLTGKLCRFSLNFVQVRKLDGRQINSTLGITNYEDCSINMFKSGVSCDGCVCHL